MSIGFGKFRIKNELVVIFLVAFILRVLFVIASNLLLPNAPLGMDYEYGVIARSVLEGHGYSAPVIQGFHIGEKAVETGVYRPTANQLPFFTLLLAGVYGIFPEHMAQWMMKLLQAGISALTCVLICLAARKVFSPWAGRIAGWGSVVFPGFIIGAARLTPEPFFTFFLIGGIYSLCLYREMPNWKLLVGAGLLFGITLLNSNVLIPILPVIGVWVFFWKGSITGKMKVLGAVLGLIFLCVSPWLIRNYLVFQKFPMFKSTMGLNFYLGNHPEGTGTFYKANGEPIETLIPDTFKENFDISEVRQDDLLMKEAKVFIQENPLRFVQLFVDKLWYFTWFPPRQMLSREVILYKKVFGFPYALLLISCLIGIYYGIRDKWLDTLFLVGVFISVAALYAIFIVGHQRYRMPVEPYLVMLAGYGLAELFRKWLPDIKEEKESSERK